MNIGPYISELLFDFECVVIPGLGGFIVNDKPASINRITHQFKPPYRQIIFNAHLRANDGLLINHIARAEGISYAEVKGRIELLVEHIFQQLEKGNKIAVEKIGVLYYDQHNHFVFEQDTAINYNPSSFGLISFVSPAITRTSEAERLKGIITGREPKKVKPVDRRPTPAKSKRTASRKETTYSLRSLVVSLGVIFLLISMGWGVTYPDKVKNYLENNASVIPFLYNNANDYVVTNIDKLSLQKEKVQYIPREETEITFELLVPDDVSIAENNNEEVSEIKEPVKEKVSSEPVEITEKPISKVLADEKIAKPVVKASASQYYVIAGSFSKENNAKRFVEELNQHGFQAQIADTNKNGMYRVAYVGMETLALAKEQLTAIRQEQNPDAWILRK